MNTSRVATTLRAVRWSRPRARAMPATPLQVIRSLMTMADMTGVMIGLSVLMIEVSLAVVFVMANRKEREHLTGIGAGVKSLTCPGSWGWPA